MTCQGVPPGSHRLRLTPDAMTFVLELLQKRHEVAGAMAIDFATNTMNILQHGMSKGKRDNVGIPKGAILPWHSHPGKCPPRGADCALDVPSDADIALVIQDCMRSSHEHWVFAHTGTFTVSLTPELRARLGSLPPQRRRAEERRIERVFAQAHKTFERRLQAKTTDLDRFRPEWIAMARREGFRVNFFPAGSMPETTLVVEGAVAARGEHF